MVCLEFAPEGMHDLGFEPDDVLQFSFREATKCQWLRDSPRVPVSDGDAIRRMMGRAEYVDLLFRHEA